MLSFSGNGIGKTTAAAGTAIVVLVPPDLQGKTRIAKLVYTAAGTAHLLSILRPLGRAKTSAAAASGQPVINLATNPTAIAANDNIAIRHSDGVTRKYVVSSVAALAITLTTNLGAAVASGADVWDFGVPTDVDPNTGRATDTLDGTASATTTYEDREVGIMASYKVDEPLLFHSNNATAAGTLVLLTFGHTIN